MDNYQDWKPVVFNNVSKMKNNASQMHKTSQKPKKNNTV